VIIKILVAVQPTVLKRDPTQQAQNLPPSQTYPLPVGGRLEITAAAPAANNHLQIKLKAALQGATTWYAYAEHIKLIAIPPPELAAAKDREKVFQTYLDIQIQEGSNQLHLSFLDQGLADSPYKDDVAKFPARLAQMPDGRTIASLGPSLKLTGSQQTVKFSPYAAIGILPTIDTTGLNFLHSDIAEACVCVGSYVNGQMQAHWLGKNALTEAQFWSATKIVPLLNVVCQSNIAAPSIAIDRANLRDPSGAVAPIGLMEAAIKMIDYQDGADSSNSLAAMFKRLSSRPQLEQWFQKLTGNRGLEFRGFYGTPPYIASPELVCDATKILTAPPEGAAGENLISAYDLTRIVTMLGWHHHIPAGARLPGAQWHSLSAVVQAMGYDSARYIDLAIATLGLQDLIRDPVIISKLGFGASDLRNRTELTYTALIQFVDPQPRATNQPAVLRTLGMTLRAAVQKVKATGDRDVDEEARVIDTRMAAEVTEILRRIVTQELA
jgi:hypothetical protein